MMGTSPIFLFDLDGTLINFSPTYSRRYAQIIRDAFAHFSITPDESLIKRIEMFGDFEAIITLVGPERADYFWFKVEQADFQLRKGMIETGEISLMPGATDVLNAIQEILPNNLPLGLVSNTNPSSAFWQLWHFGLMPYFKHIYLLNWNFVTPKPDPAGFLACVAEYGPVGQFRVVYVGDSPSDIEMVKRARVILPDLQAYGILLKNGGTSKCSRETGQFIASLSELPALAQKFMSTSFLP
jgi:phosphoglycolate phosphatase-like HAD superfamily hydrolase